MQKNLPLSFIRERIQELQQALFFNCSRAVLQIPTQIVHTLFTDDLGQVWFVVPKPLQYIGEFDKEFPAKLDFLRKGIKFSLQISGKAYIVLDPEELNHLLVISEDLRQKVRNSELVLMKVKIQDADFFEYPAHTPNPWFKNISNSITQWFFYKQHSLQTHAKNGLSLKNAAHLPKIFSH